MVVKAISFALIGVINTVIDASVFFLALRLLNASELAQRFIAAAVGACACAGIETATLVIANVLAWYVAVSCSYAMNSFITFAAESGRRLRLWDYARFVASGIAGVIANTATLVIAAQYLPIWGAKALAIGVSFMVNFLLSHFVVFRPRPPSEAKAPTL